VGYPRLAGFRPRLHSTTAEDLQALTEHLQATGGIFAATAEQTDDDLHYLSVEMLWRDEALAVVQRVGGGFLMVMADDQSAHRFNTLADIADWLGT
jgi:hypothetical protein